MLNIKGFKYLVFLPSFYGLLSWNFWLVLYLLKLLEWDETSAIAIFIFFSLDLFFLFSLLVFLPKYTSIFTNKSSIDYIQSFQKKNSQKKFDILFFYTIGFLGNILYILDFSSALGGINSFLFALVSASYTIRSQTADTTSIGFQLSYFGWISIALIICGILQKNLSKRWILAAIVQLIMNFLYIDRTRPIWIGFTCLVTILPLIPNLNISKIIKFGVLSTISSITIFAAGAQWAGKVYAPATSLGKTDNSLFTSAFNNIYFYGTSGFAYFNGMIQGNEYINYVPRRILYPLLQILSSLGWLEKPPSQIIENLSIPFTTNVGTFLEPFYRDGGLPFVFLGILVYSFGLDFLGLQLIKSKTPIALYAWSNLCFINFIGFFTPKIASPATWLFISLAFLRIFLSLKFINSKR